MRGFDARGHRIDFVEYHPAYHLLMAMAIEDGIQSRPWISPKAGAHVARATYEYMQVQVEAGHGCPITMSFAAVPILHEQPNLAEQWLPLLWSEV